MGPKERRFQRRGPQIRYGGVGKERRSEPAQRSAVDDGRQDPGEDAEQQRIDVEQARDGHQCQEARHDEILDRVDAEHLECVELLADLARPEVGGDRVPATPASTIAVTNGANSRIEASTKKPPSRSMAPKRTRKFAACRPGAP